MIATASWFVPLPPDATAVGISRGTPRGRSAFHRLRDLELGPWFRAVSPTSCLKRYGEILNRLDASEIRERLLEYGPMPVMLCFEHAMDIQAGRCFCHRHLVAQWLEDQLGIEVPELDHPQLDRFTYLRTVSTAPRRYQSHNRGDE
jgi:hypothetical protein